MTPTEFYLKKLREFNRVQRIRELIVLKGKHYDSDKYPEGVPERIVKRRVQAGPKFRRSVHMVKITSSWSSSEWLQKDRIVPMYLTSEGNTWVVVGKKKVPVEVFIEDKHLKIPDRKRTSSVIGSNFSGVFI